MTTVALSNSNLNSQTEETWKLQKEKAAVFLKSGFLPFSIKTPEQVLLIMQMGSELGLKPLEALNSINVIQGRPTLSAQGMRSQIFKHMPEALFNVLESTPQMCVIEAARPGGKPSKFSYSIEEAGLVRPNSPWTKTPKDMLIARCTSRIARTLFADALSGVSYTPEEVHDFTQDQPQVVRAIDMPVEEPKPADEPKGFDPQNSDHVDWLEKQLKIYKVSVADPDHADQLLDICHGKKSEDVIQIIKSMVKV
jgi:hypothetical protein